MLIPLHELQILDDKPLYVLRVRPINEEIERKRIEPLVRELLVIASPTPLLFDVCHGSKYTHHGEEVNLTKRWTICV